MGKYLTPPDYIYYTNLYYYVKTYYLEELFKYSLAWGIYYTVHKNLEIKGTVTVISSDPAYNNSHTRFTTVPLKPLSD